jgi:hypothetical protein
MGVSLMSKSRNFLQEIQESSDVHAMFPPSSTWLLAHECDADEMQ